MLANHHSRLPNTTFKKSAIATAVAMALTGYMQTASAATFTVTTLDPTGPGSLNEAIGLANADPDADVIDFQAGLTGNIDVSGSLTDITEPLTLTGPGSDVLTVQNTNDCAVSCSDLFTAGSAGDVTISGLTLDKANADFEESLIEHTGSGMLTIEDSVLHNTSGAMTINGGGIHSNSIGDLVVRNTTITGQVADGNGGRRGNNGGGIYATGGGNVTLENVMVNNNSSDDDGAGISADNVDTLIVRNSTFDGNDGDIGTGVFADEVNAVTLENISITNGTGTRGVGVYIEDVTALIIRNSVFDNNSISGSSSSRAGAALWVNNTLTSSISIDNSVFTRNSAPDAAAMFINVRNTNIDITNTTIANNTGATSILNILSPDNVTNNVALNVSNTTISGNSTTNSVGGAPIRIGGGGDAVSGLDADFLNVTIVNNSIPIDNVENTAVIDVSTTGSGAGGEITFVNSIVSNNIPSDAGTLPEIIVDSQLGFTVNNSFFGNDDGTPISGDNNMIANFNGDATVFDSILNSVADNGGTRVGANSDIPLSTHTIQDGSSIINAGDQTATGSSIALPATDQRGTGFNRLVGGNVDIGAIEFDPTPTPTPTGSENNTSGGGGGGGSTGLGFIFGLLTLLGFRRRK